MTNLLAIAILSATTPHLVANWRGNGDFKDSVSGQPAHPMAGVVFVDGPTGKAFDFDGVNSVVHIPDSNRFKLTEGLTISCWVRARQKPGNGSSTQAQIVFRGDDRPGLDPYRLDLSNDMKWQFGIEDETHDCTLTFPATLNEWTHLCGTWDGATGIIRLYVNGDLVAENKADFRPLKDLDDRYSPGIAIGNVQNPFGTQHWQPLNGSVADVRIYDGALSKSDYVEPKG